MSIAARTRLTGLDARRADTIYAGAVVFRTVLELAGADEATLCETALREGIIADYVASNRPGMLLVDEFPDLRRRTVMELARRCQFREDHGTHVARHGAVDLRPDAPACTSWRRATASCWNTRRCCTTSASTSRPTATTATART